MKKPKHYSLKLCQRLPICLKGKEVYDKHTEDSRHIQIAVYCCHATQRLFVQLYTGTCPDWRRVCDPHSVGFLCQNY